MTFMVEIADAQVRLLEKAAETQGWTTHTMLDYIVHNGLYAIAAEVARREPDFMKSHVAVAQIMRDVIALGPMQAQRGE